MFCKWFTDFSLIQKTQDPEDPAPHHRTLSNASPASAHAEGQESIILSLNNQNGNQRTIQQKINSYSGSRIRVNACIRITVKACCLLNGKAVCSAGARKYEPLSSSAVTFVAIFLWAH